MGSAHNARGQSASYGHVNTSGPCGRAPWQAVLCCPHGAPARTWGGAWGSLLCSSETSNSGRPRASHGKREMAKARCLGVVIKCLDSNYPSFPPRVTVSSDHLPCSPRNRTSPSPHAPLSKSDWRLRRLWSEDADPSPCLPGHPDLIRGASGPRRQVSPLSCTADPAGGSWSEREVLSLSLRQRVLWCSGWEGSLGTLGWWPGAICPSHTVPRPAFWSRGDTPWGQLPPAGPR